MNAASKVADRREDHLKGARSRLERWRYQTWSDLYSKRPWGYQVLLPDKVLTAVATKAHLATVADLIRAGWSPTHSQKHGDAVLELLRSYDFVWHQQAEAEKAEKARLRKEKTLADSDAAVRF
jgi:hypothetical protein